MQTVRGFAAVAAFVFATAADAALITSGFTYAVASAGGAPDTGTHFHSNTGGAFGNPAGKAEVGRFTSEEVRGLSEYNLAGLANSASAFVTFTVFKEGGLFAGTNDLPFAGRILVDAYLGNNLEDISDYQALSTGNIGSFIVSSAAVNVGDVFSFDITSIFNTAITSGNASLGVRLREDRANADYSLSRAWTFENFRLTSDNQTTAIPEPATLVLVAAALAGLAWSQRRRT